MMADLNIKKIRIKKEDLPNFIGNNDVLTYDVRYRIVSDDKNKVSHWSPVYTIVGETTTDETGYDPNNPETTSLPYNTVINSQDSSIQISWTMPSFLILNPTEQQKELQSLQSSIKEFDIYVQWQVASVWSEWIWAGISLGTQFTTIYPNDAEAMKFRIQKVTQDKQPFDAATYLITSSQDLAYSDSVEYISSVSNIMQYL